MTTYTYKDLRDDHESTPVYLPCPVHRFHDDDPIDYGATKRQQVEDNMFGLRFSDSKRFRDSRGRTYEGRLHHEACISSCHECYRKANKNEDFVVLEGLPYCNDCYDAMHSLDYEDDLLFPCEPEDERLSQGALWKNKSTSSVSTYVIEKVTETKVHYYDTEFRRHCVKGLERFLETSEFLLLARGSISENRSKQAHFGQAAKQHFVWEALDVPSRDYVGPNEDGGPLISILIYHRNEETPIHIQDMVLDSEAMVQCCLQLMTLWKNLGNLVFLYEHGNERVREFIRPRPTNAANGVRFGEAFHPGPHTLRRNTKAFQAAKRTYMWDLYWQDPFTCNDPVMRAAIKKFILCAQGRYESACKKSNKTVDRLLKFKVIQVKAQDDMDRLVIDGAMYTNFVQVYFERYDGKGFEGRMDSTHCFINYKTGTIFSAYKTNSALIESVGKENVRGNVLEHVQGTLSPNGRLIRSRQYRSRPRITDSPYCLRMPEKWKQRLKRKASDFFVNNDQLRTNGLNVVDMVLESERDLGELLQLDCVRDLPKHFMSASDVASRRPYRASNVLKKFLLKHVYDWWNVWFDDSLKFTISWKLFCRNGVHDKQTAVAFLRKNVFFMAMYPPVDRPKSAASGVRFGEASNPGPPTKVVLRFDNDEAVPDEEPTFRTEFKTVDFFLIKSEEQVRHEEECGDISRYPKMELIIGQKYLVPPSVHGQVYRRPIDRSGWSRRGAMVEEVHYNAWGTLVRVCRKRARQPKYIWGGSNGAPYCPRNDRNLRKIWKPKRRKKRKPKKYVVEALKRRFLKGDKVYFEVAWAGYEETTEEPRSQLIKDVPLLIEAFESRPKSAANGVRFGEASNPGPTDSKRKREEELEAEIRECEARVSKMKREITDLRRNNACLGNKSIEELLDKVTKTTGSMTHENRKYQDVVFRPYDIDRETAIIWSHGKLDLSVERRDFKDNYNYVVSRGVQPFTVLPKSIGTGTLRQSLKHLTLNFNMLKELPDAIGNLSVLEEFYMCGTREKKIPIKRLPSTIVNCQMLETIVISYTELDSLPMNFGALGNLTYLGLENNRLRSLPDSIQKLHKLRYLNIQYNELTHLPEFDERSNLEEIIAYRNTLTKDSFPASIAKLKQLKKLNIAYNDIREFPNALIQLQRSLPKLWIYHKIKIAARGQVWKRRQGGYYAVILGKDENHLHLVFVSATGEWKSMWKPVTEVSEERRFLLSEFLDTYEYVGQFDGSRWKYMGSRMDGVVSVRLTDDNKVRFGKEEFDREYLYEIKSSFLIRAIFVSAPDVYEKII